VIQTIPPGAYVVKPDWVEACIAANERLNEADYALPLEKEEDRSYVEWSCLSNPEPEEPVEETPQPEPQKEVVAPSIKRIVMSRV